MTETDNAASARPGIRTSSRAMWLEFGLTLGAALGARLLAGTVHGAPSTALRVLAALLLIAFLLRTGHWAEQVARRKGIYHPQYYVLGPIGLVMALAATSNPEAAPPTDD